LRERVWAIEGIVGEVLRERGIGKRVSVGAVEELGCYEWPGNVEELEGVVLRTGMLVGGEEIGRGDWVWGFERGGAKGERGKRGKEGEGIKEEGKGEKGEEEGEKIGEGGKDAGGVEVLLSTLVHEVKNPLVAISTFAHLLPERYGEEEFRGEFSKLVGLEVKRLNGVLEMLLEYGQLGTPRPSVLDLGGWLKKYGEEKKGSLNQKILMEWTGSPPPVRFDERHLYFVLERIVEEISSRGMAGGEVRMACKEATPEEDMEIIEISYDEQEAFAAVSARGVHPSDEESFEGLSLGLGLARRIMEQNKGEMGVLRGQGDRKRIVLRFPGKAFGRSAL
jgi:two-component sensor histidine kinase